MPKPRQPLNDKQTEILLTLYKFRFATKDRIVQYLQLDSGTYTQVRIKNLLDQGYIGRHYTGQDKLAGKPAIYYLDSKGIRFLLQPDKLKQYELNPKVLNLCYKDKNGSVTFQKESLQVFDLYLKFTELYGDDVDFYTKSELNEYDHFLSPRPVAYISFSGKYQDKADCILELMDSSKSYFIHRRRINQYFKQFTSGKWQQATGSSDYPTILLLTDTQNLANRLQRSVAFSLNSREIKGLNIHPLAIQELYRTLLIP